MAIDKVRAYFAQFGMESRVCERELSCATVELAAAALGVAPARIAKSLSFQTGDGPILIIVAGDAKVDNAKYKQQFGVKASMLKFAQVEAQIGHAVGGVCPFGINEGVHVYLDESLKRFETVFPSAGSENSMIELRLDELERYAQNLVGWVNVTKGWED